MPDMDWNNIRIDALEAVGRPNNPPVRRNVEGTAKSSKVIPLVDPHLQKYMYGGQLDIRELNHRYSNQIIGLPKIIKGVEVIIPVMVVQFDYSYTDDGIFLSLFGNELRNGRYKDVQAFLLNDIVCKWDVPNTGVLNYKDMVIYIQYLAGRVWRRGLSSKSLKIIDPNKYTSNVVKYGGKRGVPSYSVNSILYDLYNPVYFTPNRAIELILSGNQRAVAISDKYFFSINMYDENILVGYKGWIVGEIKDNIIILKAEVKHLYEELSEYYPCTYIGQEK